MGDLTFLSEQECVWWEKQKLFDKGRNIFILDFKNKKLHQESTPPKGDFYVFYDAEGNGKYSVVTNKKNQLHFWFPDGEKSCTLENFDEIVKMDENEEYSLFLPSFSRSTFTPDGKRFATILYSESEETQYLYV